MKTKAIAAFLVLLVCGVIAGCGDRAGSRDERIKRGDSFLSQGKVAEAIVEYRSAVKADPQSGLARRKLGDAYIKVNDAQNAVTELVKAADLMPADLETQLLASRVLLLTGQFEDARGRAEKILVTNPNNLDAQILKGNALAGLKDFTGALNALEGAVATDPTQSAGYAHLAALQLARGDVSSAEAAFKRAAARDPKSVSIKLALANLYWSSGRIEEAEKQIRESVTLEPQNLVPNRGLAMLLLGANRLAEAEEPLKAVARLSPDNTGRIALADYYANVRREGDARAIYDELAKGSDDFAATAKLRLAALGLYSGDTATARRLIGDVLAKDPKHVEALIGQAQIDFSENKLTEAMASVNKAIAVGRTLPMPHFLKGRILRAEYQPEEAEAAYKEAIRISPQFAPAHLELARLALASGQNIQAIAFAQAAINSVPGLGDSYVLLARARLANGDVSGAEATLRMISSRLPDSPVVRAELGRLQMARGDEAGARASFNAVLAKVPADVTAIEGLVTLDAQTGRKDAARRRLDDAVAAAQKNSEMLVVAGRLYMTLLRDTNAAERTVRVALDANPGNLQAFGLLARIHIEKGDLAGATKEFEELARRQPKSITNHTAVGMLYHLQGQLDNARAAYERALTIDSKAPVASNNLAQIYSDRNESLDVGIQLAKNAKASLPTSHEIDDTLGWLYYKKGDPLFALGPLRAAVSAQPNNATYLYHLGAAYALNKDRPNARQALEKALRAGPFAEADDARRLLDSLK